MSKLALIIFLVFTGTALAQPALTKSAFVGSTGSSTLSTSSVNYVSFDGISAADANLGSPSEITFETLSSLIGMTLSHFCCFVGTAPGLGKSYAFVGTAQGGGDMSITVTISDTATSACDVTHSQVLGFGRDNVGIKVTPTGTPAAATAGCYVEAVPNL